ncbi:hypothetical protein EFQ32_04465, partial [Limosilactobacillus fermentum]|nr:hypothetical protein [Limosilactobacillus fermentum]
DCLVTPLKTLMGFSVYLNVQLKFYNLPLSLWHGDRGGQLATLLKAKAGTFPDGYVPAFL